MLITFAMHIFDWSLCIILAIDSWGRGDRVWQCSGFTFQLATAQSTHSGIFQTSIGIYSRILSNRLAININLIHRFDNQSGFVPAERGFALNFYRSIYSPSINIHASKSFR